MSYPLRSPTSRANKKIELSPPRILTGLTPGDRESARGASAAREGKNGSAFWAIASSSCSCIRHLRLTAGHDWADLLTIKEVGGRKTLAIVQRYAHSRLTAFKRLSSGWSRTEPQN